MKKAILIFISLLFLGNVNGQDIEKFAKNYRDTSKILAYNIDRIDTGNEIYLEMFSLPPGSAEWVVKRFDQKAKKTEEFYPTPENSNFIFEIGQEVKTNGYLSYTLIDEDYTKKLNKERKAKGSPPLVNDIELNKVALERCIKMINLQVKKDHTLRIDHVNIYYKKGHEGFSTSSENAHLPIYYSHSENTNNINLFLTNIYSPFISMQISLLSAYVICLKDEDPRFDIQNAWNNSKTGHYENRINKKYKKFGYAFVIVEVFKYDERKGKNIRFTISSAYEVFE